MESKKKDTRELIYKIKDSQTERTNLWFTKRERGREGQIRRLGLTYTHYCIEDRQPIKIYCIAQGYTQNFVITYKGKESEYVCIYIYVSVCIHIYVYMTESLLCT